MTRIDVKPFVRLGRQKRLPFKHYDHHDGCELEHVACAVLFLAGALDSAQSMIEELLADRDSEHKWAEQYHAQWQEAKAEIERLTEGNKRLAQEIVNRAVDMGEMQDKIDSLTSSASITPDMIDAATAADRERFTVRRLDRQLQEAQAVNARLRAQLESAKAWMPAWAQNEVRLDVWADDDDDEMEAK